VNYCPKKTPKFRFGSGNLRVNRKTDSEDNTEAFGILFQSSEEPLSAPSSGSKNGPRISRNNFGNSDENQLTFSATVCSVSRKVKMKVGYSSKSEPIRIYAEFK